MTQTNVSQIKKVQDPSDVAAVPISTLSFCLSFFVLYVLFALDLAARLGVTATFPTMQKEIGVTDGQLGMIGSAVLVGMTAFVLPFAYAADKWGRKRAISLMGLIWGAGSLITGMGTSFVGIISGRFLVGMGNSSYAPVSVASLTSWVRKSRWGRVIGLYNSSMYVGISTGTMLSGVMIARYGWRSVFYMLGVGSIIFAVISLLLPASSPQGAKKEQVSMIEAASLTLKNKTLLLISTAVGFANMVAAAGVVWLPMFLSRYLEWTPAEIGAKLGTLYLLAGLTVPPLSGYVSDKLGHWDKRTRAWLGVSSFVLSGTATMLGFLFHSFPLIVVGRILFPIPIAGIHTATQELVPARYKSSAYGIYVIIIQGFAIAGPVVTGFLSAVFGLEHALIAIQFLLMIASLLLLVAGFTYMKDYNRARTME